MKTFKTPLIAVGIVVLATGTIFAQAHYRSKKRNTRMTQQQILEIIERTDLAR